MADDAITILRLSRHVIPCSAQAQDAITADDTTFAAIAFYAFLARNSLLGNAAAGELRLQLWLTTFYAIIIGGFLGTLFVAWHMPRPAVLDCDRGR